MKKKSSRKSAKKTESRFKALLSFEVPKPILFGSTLVLIVVIALITAVFFPGSRFQSIENLKLQQKENKSQNQNLPAITKLKVASEAAKPTTILSYVPQSVDYQLRVPILMYHYISNNPNPEDRARYSLSTPPDLFESEMKYLIENDYTTLTLDTLYVALQKSTTLPIKPVILTFDDGYIDFYINAFPILRRFNLHATVFIPTGLMNQGYYLQWSQIQEMQASGLVHFGAHTVNHAHLPALSADKILFELTESKRILQDKLGVPINFLSYPGGSTNSQIIELTKKAGYMGSVGTWAGLIQSKKTIYNMPRVRINGYIDLTRFINFL